MSLISGLLSWCADHFSERDTDQSIPGESLRLDFGQGIVAVFVRVCAFCLLLMDFRNLPYAEEHESTDCIIVGCMRGSGSMVALSLLSKGVWSTCSILQVAHVTLCLIFRQ